MSVQLPVSVVLLQVRPGGGSWGAESRAAVVLLQAGAECGAAGSPGFARWSRFPGEQTQPKRLPSHVPPTASERAKLKEGGGGQRHVCVCVGPAVVTVSVHQSLSTFFSFNPCR